MRFVFVLLFSFLHSETAIAYSLRFENYDFVNNRSLLDVLLPFYQNVIELLWKKIFHDEKFIIGEIQSSDGEDGIISTV